MITGSSIDWIQIKRSYSRFPSEETSLNTTLRTAVEIPLSYTTVVVLMPQGLLPVFNQPKTPFL